MFADDLDIFIKNNERNWSAMQQAIDMFEKISGLKVSYEKSSVYRIGSARDGNAKQYSKRKLQWSKDKVNILGIWIADSDASMIRENIDPLFDKIEAIFKLWSQRGLSLIGKILIANTLVASLFVYKMMVLPLLHKSYYQKIEQITLKFIWQERKSKITKKVLYGNKEDGGLGLVRLDKKDMSLKISWMQKIKQNEKIKELLQANLRCDVEMIWGARVNAKDLNNCTQSNFWKDVILS